ncbi:phage major capsid protein [Streptosporangium saharense]|uniref:phage major capsid protein n=1 Tax=Streptosporangium saharense TaxID=1706840 RepID=UPI003443E9C6
MRIAARAARIDPEREVSHVDVSIPFLEEQRARLKGQMTALLDRVKREQRDSLNPGEARQFDELKSSITDIDNNLREAREDERRENRAATLAVQYGQTGEAREHMGPTASFRTGASEATYRKGDPHGPSFLKDLIGVQLRGDADAAERLRRNNREVQIEHRALSTTDGAGGEFVPPLWLINEYVALARPARVVANLVRKAPMPTGTDSINLPRLATGTAVAEQATQNTAIQNTDATTNSITAAVATIAGQQVVSLQLIEQSPINMDEELLRDLLADLAVKTDTFVISNNATNKVGVLNVAGVNAITYTDASPTVGELYGKVADAIQQIGTGRYLPPDVIAMHPRRWAWLMAASDTANRPLVTPAVNGPTNALAISTGTTDPTTGLVGSMMGLPVFVDSNIPTNLGAGTNEDRILIMNSQDVILFEGTPRAEVFREPLAAQMSVLLRTYNYVALHASRYPKSISVIGGTGLAAPVF